MTRLEAGGVLEGEWVLMGTGSARYGSNEQRLVVPDAPAVDDHAFQPCDALRQNW